MKKTLLFIFSLMLSLSMYACPVCERAKARQAAFGNITHGAGPTSNWDYLAVWIVIVAVVLTLFYTIKYLVKPKEKNNDHIKYTILNFE